MKKVIKRIIKLLLEPCYFMLCCFNQFLLHRVSNGFKVQWRLSEILEKNKLTFDHEIDLYHRLQEAGQFWFGSIASFNLAALRMYNEPVVLELGCSDGFYANYFYKHIPKIKYLGVDLDVPNLEKAKHRLKSSKRNDGQLSVKKCNFLTDMPVGEYTNVFWFESINMFSDNEQNYILSQIASRLKCNKGILCGDGVLKIEGKKQWDHYISLWESIESVYDLLKRHFKNVYVYTMDEIPDDAVLFMASDGDMPVGDGIFYFKKK